MLLTVATGIKGGICHVFHQCAKANNKSVKNYDRNKGSTYLKYWDVNNLYGCAISQKWPVDCFNWIENTSQFNKDLMKNYNDHSDEGYFLEVDVQ